MRDASEHSRIGDALRWALEPLDDPARVAADWLTRDLAPKYDTAFQLLADPDVSREHLVAAKNAFKTMRIVGETAADRQLAMRLYALSIAAGLIRFDELITRQTPDAVARVLALVRSEMDLPEPIRDLACAACDRLNRHP